MEVLVFADAPFKPVGDSLVSSLETWDGPVTLLTSRDDVAASFQAMRTKPFTRAFVNSRWAPLPLPPMTASVESNILSVLGWQHEQQAQKMLAFQSVADDPQGHTFVVLLSSRGLVNTTAFQVSQHFHKESRAVVLTSEQTPSLIVVPAADAPWFFAEWIQRHTQASQELLDALLDQPLTLDAYHKELSSSHALATFQWLALRFPDRVAVQPVDLMPGEFSASVLSRVVNPVQFSASNLSRVVSPVQFSASTLASTSVPVNDVTGNATAWVFFALVAVALVLGLGVIVGGVRAARATPSPLESRWKHL
jgi:hypothetical protein